MRTQITKRFNVNLTDREQAALESLEHKMMNRGQKMTTSDIIREAIVYYCEKETGYTLTNKWKLKETNWPGGPDQF